MSSSVIIQILCSCNNGVMTLCSKAEKVLDTTYLSITESLAVATAEVMLFDLNTNVFLAKGMVNKVSFPLMLSSAAIREMHDLCDLNARLQNVADTLQLKVLHHVNIMF